MLDASKRQELVSKLRNKIKQSSSNVSTKIEASKGQYGVVISESNIDHFFDKNKVFSIKVAELDSDIVELINSDPQDAAQEILGEFIASFTPDELKSEIMKQAANEVVDKETQNKITQKQLDSKTSLHPRLDSHYKNVTQKQLAENGQRPGTYEVTTEAQFRDERTTFYGEERLSGDWKNENRNTVTEGQFKEGVGEFTEFGASERGSMGAKFDGGVESQQGKISEKQLMDLLKHHKWSEPLTTTEGKDQLGKQEGQLARLTAEAAENIIKQASDAFGKTVLAVGITPKELIKVASKLISDPSKYKVLANVLRNYSSYDVSSIERKVAKARHFGKTANTGSDWSEFLAADVLVRQLSKIAYDASHVVDGLVAMNSTSDFEERINEASDLILKSNENTNKTAATEATSVFHQVLSPKDLVQGDDSDGRYAFAGKIEEVTEATGVKAENKNAFSKAAASYAAKKISEAIKKELNLVPDVLDVDTKKGVFEIQFTEASARSKELERRAAKRRQLQKEAENMKISKTENRRNNLKTAQMGGMGGMPPAAGSEMGNPAMPPGGGDMGPPPGEALSQDASPSEEKLDDMGGSEPKPPGSFCPACSSEDVDVDNGELRCNNCGAEGTVHFIIDMNKWPGSLEESGEEEKEGFDLSDKGIGAEEEGMGSGTTLPNVPVAASFRLTHRILQKLASEKVAFGSVCPNCGSTNTETSKSASHKGNDGVCWSCMQEYNVQVKAAKNKKNSVYGQYVWKPVSASSNCNDCNRMHKAFVQSLKDYGSSWSEFSNLKSASEQANLILKMAKSGTLSLDDAMSEPLPIKKIASSSGWKGYEKFENFPTASCVERLSRRYGENATSMSGPCQGKPLAECVCKQLTAAGVYSDGLAAKVASMQSNNNPFISSPMKTCVSMFVRQNNMDVDDACIVCDAMRAAYASGEELVVEAICQIDPEKTKPMMMPKKTPNKIKPKKPMMSDESSPCGTPDPCGMPDPISDVIVDSDMGNETEIGHEMGHGPDSGTEMSIEIEKDIDLDDMASQDLIGLGEESVTIKLPNEAMDALKILMDALKGQISESDIDNTEIDTDILDMSDVNSNSESETPDSEIPGLMEDSESEDSELDEKSITEDFGGSESEESSFEESDSEDSDELEESEELEDSESEESEELEDSESEESEELEDSESEDSGIDKHTENDPTESKEDVFSSKQKTASLENDLMHMKGSIKTYQSSLNNVFDGLLAQAQASKNVSKSAAKADEVKKVEYKDAPKGSPIKATPAQKSTEMKFQDGGTIGAEESFTKGVASKVDVPRKKQLLGDEGNDMGVDDESYPSIPSGDGLMGSEENYKPEKGNVVDGNQGATTASSQMPKKSASVVWNVSKGHKNYATLMKKAEANESVKLSDGLTYEVNVDQNENIVLIAKGLKKKIKDCKPCSKADKTEKKDCKASKESKIKKESQSVTPNVVTLENDKDLSPSSGPGKGKIKGDTTHSLAVDEKKPSEGMDKPNIPKDPNGGQLTREHTFTNELDRPEYPAGGGSHPDYDTNEKNSPEKQDKILGIDATASKEEAIKIAGQLLKMNEISIDELPEKVRELSKASSETLADYKKLIAKLSTTKGLQRKASQNSVESSSFLLKAGSSDDEKGDLKKGIQKLFTLNRRNEDYGNLSNEKGNHDLWR